MTHVLVVDDAKILGHLLTAAYATLEADIHATAVATAEEAEAALQNEGADLLVIDVHLPGKSGLELTRKVRKLYPKIKIIDISGLNDPNLHEKALAAGADAFFPKPIEMMDFLELSANFLGIQRVPADKKAHGEDLRPPAPDLVVNLLTGLRQELSAKEVILIDHRGQIMAKAGEGNNALLEQIIPPLMNAASAGQKISSLLAAGDPENVLAFRGQEEDLIFCSIEAEYFLAVTLPHNPSRVKLAIAFDAVASAQHDLRSRLGSLGLLAVIAAGESIPAATGRLHPTAEPAAEGEPPQTIPLAEKDADLEKVLIETTRKKMKPVEVDSFWDAAVAEVSPAAPSTPDLLTFEQAQRLGLTPNEAEKTSPDENR